MHSATTSYLALYGGTLVVHVVFMNYVLGGTAFLAAASVLRFWRRSEMAPDPIVEKARDWMPFALGAAITAGVAPLLFLQILYDKPFYTANLLLLHRWMSIVPVLILAFYLLYVLKSKPFERRWMPLVAVGSFLCIAWTGLAWTENHELSLEKENWPAFYESRFMWFREPRVWIRFSIWLSGSLPIFAMLIAWQLYARGRHGEPFVPRSRQRLERMARAGLLISLATAAVYASRLDAVTRGAIESPLGWTAMLGAAIGMLGQGAGWSRIRADDTRSGGWMCVVTGAALVTAVATSVLREMIRVAALEPLAVTQHGHAAGVGGFWVFVFALLLNAALIAWCVRIGLRATRGADRPPV